MRDAVVTLHELVCRFLASATDRPGFGMRLVLDELPARRDYWNDYFVDDPKHA